MAVKHNNLKGKYDQLKNEAENRFATTAVETKMATRTLLRLNDIKYRHLSTKMNEKYDRLKARITTMYKDVDLKEDCSQILQMGNCKSGAHTIRPKGRGGSER